MRNSNLITNKAGKIQVEFSAKNLTLFGGTRLLIKFFEKIGLKGYLNQVIRNDTSKKTKYKRSSLLFSFITAISMGKTRPFHTKIFAFDEVFLKLAGLTNFPHFSTISRFLNSVTIHPAKRLASANQTLLFKVRNEFRNYSCLTLDLDSHVKTVYGEFISRAKVGYNPKKKGRKSHHPLLCFIGETGDYLAGMLRPGNEHTASGAKSFLERILKKIPKHIKRLRLRADSGFFSLEFLAFLEQKGIEYFVVVPLQSWVQKFIRSLGPSAFKEIDSGIGIAESAFPFGDRQRRLVIIREEVKEEAKPRKKPKLFQGYEEAKYDWQVIVTNSQMMATDVWHFYNQRACCENFIKEGIYGFGLDNNVCKSFEGNALWFEMVMFAYNLLNWFKEMGLGLKLRKRFVSWVRERVLLIPGKLVKRSRRFILKLPKDWPFKEWYFQAEAALE